MAYILTVSPARGEELIHAADHWGPTVVQPVQYFSRPTRSPFIVFTSFQSGAITHIANGERGLRAGTNMVQLRMNDLERLAWPIESSAALDAVSSRLRTHLARYFDRSGFLPRQTSKSFIAFMRKTDPKDDERLKQLQRPHGETASLTPTAEENLAFEKDAVGLLLRAGGMDPHILLNWRGLESENKPDSYLGSLPVSEDTMIRRDASTLPGFDAFRSSAMNYGAYTFRGRGWRSPTTMTIVVAHPDRLEQRTGADLIYLNQEYQSIAMVQYKAMTERNGKWEFRWQDGDRFSDQLVRSDERAQATDDQGRRLL